jgi:hypothetical protein
VVASKRFVKIFTLPPCQVGHEEFSRTCTWLSNYLFFILILNALWEVFPFKCNYNATFQFFDWDYSTMKCFWILY